MSVSWNSRAGGGLTLRSRPAGPGLLCRARSTRGDRGDGRRGFVVRRQARHARARWSFPPGKGELRSSQVGRSNPTLAPRWDRARRMDTALGLLGRLKLKELISHRIPFEEAPEAYTLLEERPEEALQVIFTYEGVEEARMYEVYVAARFEAAHRLVGDFGPATRTHGHTYRLEVIMRGQHRRRQHALRHRRAGAGSRESGRLHALQGLNEVPGLQEVNTTAEAVASYCWEKLAEPLRGQGLDSLTVRIWSPRRLRSTRRRAGLRDFSCASPSSRWGAQAARPAATCTTDV